MTMGLMLLLVITFFISFVSASKEIVANANPNYYVKYQILNINCTSSENVQNNNFYINVGVQQEASIFYKTSTGQCIRIISGKQFECVDDCKCTSDGKSVSYSYNVTTENSTLNLTCLADEYPVLKNTIIIRKASKPYKNLTITSDPELYVNESSILRMRCTVYGGYPLATISFTCENRGLIAQIAEESSSITANLTFQVEKTDNNRICTCVAAHELWSHPEEESTKLIVYYSPNPKVILKGITNSTYLYEHDSASIKCEVSGGNPLAELDFTCGNEKGINGNNSSSSFSTLVMNVTRNLNSQLCICTAQHLLFANGITGVIRLQVYYEPYKNLTIITDQELPVNENSTLRLRCTVYGGNPLASISFACEDREVMEQIVEETSSITAELTFQVEQTDNNRICTCVAAHELWSQPEKESTKLTVYYSPNPMIIFDGINNSTDLYEFDTASINCIVSGGNPLAELDFTCGQYERGMNGSNNSSSFSSIVMNITRDLNSELCTCTARHLLFAKEVRGVILLQVYYPPSKPLLIVTPSQPFLEGQFVEVTCNTTDGNPHIYKYEWYINTTLTTIDQKRYIYGNVSEEDNDKNIGCRVYNRYTEFKNISVKSDTMKFNVEYVPRILNIPQKHIIVEGQSIQVQCKAVGNPYPYVYWEHNDQPASNTQRSETVLNLTDTERNIQGIYTCKAYSMSSHGQLNSSLSTHLTVNYPPDVSVVAFGQDMIEGSSVTLMCNASGQPPKYHFEGWEHSYRAINIRNTIHNNGSHLFLMELSYQDTGKYTCSVHNGIRKRNQTMIQKASHELKVIGAPIRIPREPAIPVFFAEQSQLLHANISFYSFPNVTNFTWYNLTSNTLLNTSGDTVVDFEEVELPYTLFKVQVNLTEFCYKASLDILNFQSYHSGYYALEVSNEEKGVNFTLRAVVSGLPEHPSNITIEVFRTSIAVHILPGFNGGHDQYIHINYTQCGQDNMFEKILYDSGIGVQTLGIDNLQPETQYCLLVFSSNTMGFSSYNNSQCCEEFIILTKKKATSQSQGSVIAIVGGTAGSTLAFILIVAVIIILRLRKNRKGGDRQHLKFKSGNSYDEDEDGLKDNPLYGSAVNNTLDHGEDSSSVGNKNQKKRTATNIEDGKKSQNAAKRQLEECIGDIQLDTVYENSNTFLDLSSATVYPNQTIKSNPTERQLNKQNQNKDGLIYADLDFAPQEGGKKFVIRGLENKTNYAFIDLNKTADPLPSDDDEILEKNT